MAKIVSFSQLVDEMKRSLNTRFKEQLPFACAVALTRTALAVRKDLQAEMSKRFDRPVQYTLNAFQVVPATKQSLSAII